MTQVKKERILVIDDDLLHANVLVQKLVKRGFDTFLITDANQVLPQLEKDHFDLVILDILMPQISGIEILKQIRKKYSRDVLPIIMMTVVSDEDRILEAFKLGANDYFTKPLNIDAAVARIRGQLDIINYHKVQMKQKELEAINALISTYHHEINNPLTVVMVTWDLIKRSTPNLSEENAQRMTNALQRMNKMLKSIGSLTKSTQIEINDHELKMIKLNKNSEEE